MIAPKGDPITEIATDLNLLKARLMNIGYYRTGRLLDIALQKNAEKAQKKANIIQNATPPAAPQEAPAPNQ